MQKTPVNCNETKMIATTIQAKAPIAKPLLLGVIRPTIPVISVGAHKNKLTQQVNGTTENITDRIPKTKETIATIFRFSLGKSIKTVCCCGATG